MLSSAEYQLSRAEYDYVLSMLYVRTLLPHVTKFTTPFFNPVFDLSLLG